MLLIGNSVYNAFNRILSLDSAYQIVYAALHGTLYIYTVNHTSHAIYNWPIHPSTFPSVVHTFKIHLKTMLHFYNFVRLEFMLPYAVRIKKPSYTEFVATRKRI